MTPSPAEAEMEERMEQLPEPFGWLHDANGNDPLTFVRGPLPENLTLFASTLPIYNYGQLQAAILAERERCARLCDAVYAEEQLEPECYGFAKECAAAIRTP